MRWGNSGVSWIRPIRSLLCIFDEKPVEFLFDKEGGTLTASNLTRGHRFLSLAPFQVTSFQDYEEKFDKAFVLLRTDKRCEEIQDQLTQQAALQGLEPFPKILKKTDSSMRWPVLLNGLLFI